MTGQISIQEYLRDRDRIAISCGKCICRNCLYWWSNRCPHGRCYDDLRAKENPYDQAHPDKPPRKGWSNWKTDQAHWCRGGIFYPAHYCGEFVRYAGSVVEDCVDAPVQRFQDGHIRCALMESIGCEACIARSIGQAVQNVYDCQHMTDSGCEKLIAAKSRMLDAIAAGEKIEPCREQCCRGCVRSCQYRCGI